MNHLLVVFLLLIVSVFASTVVFETGLPSQRLVGLSIHDLSLMDAVNARISCHKLDSQAGFAQFTKDITQAFPSVDIVTDIPILEELLSQCYGAHFLPANGSKRKYDEERDLDDIVDWMSSISYFAADKLPVVLENRENILEEGVRAYKAFDRIPFTAPYHLFHRNLKVELRGDYEDESNPILNRLEFFELFFTAALRTNDYFMRNPEGRLIFADNDNLTEQDMDFYEAFGFYLAKVFQSNLSTGLELHLLPQIVQVIKTGKTTASFPLKWRSQALMLALGFVRACPAFILDTYPLMVLALAL